MRVPAASAAAGSARIIRVQAAILGAQAGIRGALNVTRPRAKNNHITYVKRELDQEASRRRSIK